MNKVTETGKTRRIWKPVHPSSDFGYVRMTSGEQSWKRRCVLNHGKVSQEVEESWSLFILAGVSALLNVPAELHAYCLLIAWFVSAQLFEYCLLRSLFGRHLPGTRTN